MSGHSKWHQIRRQKGVTDQKRGKIFSRHSKLITVAARHGGGEPEMNARLRMAIENARADNMPKDNIERAIKKGTGELGEGGEFFEMAYEGFGPGGVALLVSAITDNKNRTAQAVRSTFTKHGGNLGGAGATAWMFEHRGVIEITLGDTGDREKIELAAIDAGAKDIVEGEGAFEIHTGPHELAATKKKLEEVGISVTSSKLTYVPKETMRVSNEGEAKQILRLVSALEDDDDVTDVVSNFDIPDEVLAKIDDGLSL